MFLTAPQGKLLFLASITIILASADPILAADPVPWVPPHGGGPCQTDWNCSLGGECTAGKCVCDVWFTGSNCTYLNLQRAKPDAGLQVPNYHSWGGHAAFDQAKGLWFGLFSFMVRRCNLDSWTTNSATVLASSKDLDGPYTLVGNPDPDTLAPGNPALIVPPWSHNTYLTRNPPDDKYLIWHIGSGQVPPSQWKNCSSGEEAPVADRCSLGQARTKGRQQRALRDEIPGDTFYVATSDSLTGSWNTSVNVSVEVNKPIGANSSYW
jgi:hypothetical protein